MIPIDPEDALKIGQIGLQIIQSVLLSENNRYNAQTRGDIAKSSELIAEMNHAHQLRMFDLQEHSRQQEKWLELGLRKEIRVFDIAAEEHRKRFEGTQERYYPPGSFITETLRDKPYPFIIISQNPNQKFNTLLGKDAPVLAPMNRITDTIRQFNSIYEDNGLLSIVATNEYFTSESDVQRFYNREINCPSIIIYPNFTSESLAINAYVSGIYDYQRSVGTKTIELNSRHELLYNISFSSIKNLISRPKESPTQLEWQSYLAEFASNLVVLHIQRYLDEYFKYHPKELYTSKTLEFIKSKTQILEQFPKLVADVTELNQSITSLKKFEISKKHPPQKGSLFIKK